MLQLNKYINNLEFTFPEVHEDASLEVSFIKTLRIPDDNESYPLPAGLGSFDLHHVDDFLDKLPVTWNDRGGVMFPMYQSEAMWIKFNAPNDYPFAVKIASGKINVITGNTWENELSNEPQDYLIAPDQKWIDGFCVEEGFIRQFVATKLGEGFSVEEQITGKADNGGIQIIAYPMKKEIYEKIQAEKEASIIRNHETMSEISFCMTSECRMDSNENYEMGLGQGGLMQQELYEDEYGFDAWDNKNYSRAFVHILNSKQWKKVTNKEPHSRPITREDYIANDIPWFEYYSDGNKPLDGSKQLNQLKTLETLMKKKSSNKKKADIQNVHTLNSIKK